MARTSHGGKKKAWKERDCSRGQSFPRPGPEIYPTIHSGERKRKALEKGKALGGENLAGRYDFKNIESSAVAGQPG